MTVNRNHYVPDFYLRLFASSAGRIYVHDKSQQVEKSQSTRDTAVERNLYTIWLPNGEIFDEIETKLLQPIESAAAPIIKALISRKGTIPKGSAEIIATFLAFLSARVPRNINVAREMGKIFLVEYQKVLARDPEKLKRLLEDYIRDTGDESMLTLEEMQKYMADPESYFDISLNRAYAVGMSFMNVSIMKQIIPTLSWSICRHHGRVPAIPGGHGSDANSGRFHSKRMAVGGVSGQEGTL